MANDEKTIRSVAELRSFTLLVDIAAPLVPDEIIYTVQAHYEPNCGRWVVVGGARSSFLLLSDAVLDSLTDEALFRGFAVTFIDPEGNSLTLRKFEGGE